MKLELLVLKASVKTKNKIRGKLVQKAGLLVWTGKVPPIPLDEAVKRARCRQIRNNL
jgi:hypothetical protein